ncbi:NHLP leader peptide family RiPP precursor (plasmid) [Nostoc sp. UHCC 0926]|uniref:NHLP leader peptide family RiPP precursor n=1 Tax=Nostoc sp. UHCC 0926 TaxID=3025190 RepID=UPI00235FC02F|nr:NHLP leader peptide family RiPP precursor [Nostoc sp. UHCC 0926]WDD36983.1 NHLP leader peptide family RiPP precursor [Nostoc sp. UHCC 0926]
MPQNKTRQEFEADIVAKTWKDEGFKQELLSNPKSTITKEFGTLIPDNIQVRVVEENPNTLYIVLPVKPADLESEEGELSENALEAVAGGATIGIYGPLQIVKS